MGLLVGGSVLTLFEVIDFVVFRLWETWLYSRDDLQHMIATTRRRMMPEVITNGSAHPNATDNNAEETAV